MEGPKELADAVATALPHATWTGRLRARRYASTPNLAHTTCCPTCGRHLPVHSLGPTAMAGGPYAGGVMFSPRLEAELRVACLVDGPRSQHARPIDVVDLLAAGEQLARALSDKAWGPWARLLGQASKHRDGPDRVEALGQGLEVFRLFGPTGLGKGPGFVPPSDPLETLIASTGRHWPRIDVPR